ncbi:dynamin family protein [Yasminevirus sp. GU-2018]|uniref:Dynamin family protein n=1 Tax=Yasminevirus sp. GU-2018 TaxID=2420051 RepID=A0A5K0UAS5_9VIRU|nr:dynamin family protein [Yasminevirus sp. GU-2018]
MASTLTSIASTVSNVWSMVGQAKQTEMALDKLTNDQLIQIADYIRDVFKNSEFLDPPTLCVVGSQSSGKSITLNGLTGIDILPNGKSIVTRTPIHLRLIHVKESKNIVVEFFDKDDSQKLISTFTVDALTTPADQLTPIREEIVKLTEMYAGRSKNVVDTPINVRIKSPSVPNLSVIDLPGLTHIALTDQGQPENIKESIENMIIKYIKNPRTIILSIIPATVDVESDAGLGLIKKHDPDFKRTIGVLTKVDMLKDSNVENYLCGKISRNLQLGYGYYAVRNRSSDEVKVMSVKDGHALEAKFFAETEPYKSSEMRQRTGSINLGIKLSEVLLAHLRSCLPAVMEEIKNKDREIEEQLNEIGRDYPNTESAKRSTLNILLHEFQREYSGAIKDRGALYNTGARIAECFRKFSVEIDQLDPFNAQVFSDGLINNMVRDYNGIHMPDVTISTGLIEKSIQGVDIYDLRDQKEQQRDRSDGISDVRLAKKIEPLRAMHAPYTKCISDVQLILTELVDTILQRDKFSRFPKLCTRMKEIITNQIISVRCKDTNDKIDDLFSEETECIWTDDQKFRCEILPSMFSKSKDGSIDPKIIRAVLTGYFNVIRGHFNHSAHKKIHTFFVNRVVEDINMKLVDLASAKGDLNNLLEEQKEKAMKRERLVKLKEKIEMAKSMINGIY